jgi:4-hydroxybenzoate polyprenyltransferase
MKKVFKFIFEEIFYNGHFQTWGSLAIIISTGQILNIKITWDLLAIVYLLFYFVYLNDRYQTLEIDSLTNVTRSAHVKKIYKYIPLILASILILLAFMLFVFSNLYASIFIIFSVPLGFLYPTHFKKLTKKIPCFKNFYVSILFSILIILPNIYYLKPLNKIEFFVLFSMFSFTFLRGVMMQLFLDLKDVEGDKKEGLLTMGVLYGREKVYNIINVLNLFTSLAFPVFYFIFPSLNLPSSVLFLTILAVWNSYFFNLAKKGNYFGFVLGSGEFIYWPVFVFLGKIIFNFL